MYGGEGFPCVLAAAQDHHAANGFALTVQLGDSTPHLRAELDARDITQSHRHSGSAELQRNLPEVVQCFQVAGSTHHVLGFRQLQHRATGFLIGPANGFDHL